MGEVRNLSLSGEEATEARVRTPNYKVTRLEAYVGPVSVRVLTFAASFYSHRAEPQLAIPPRKSWPGMKHSNQWLEL